MCVVELVHVVYRLCKSCTAHVHCLKSFLPLYTHALSDLIPCAVFAEDLSLL